MSYEEAKERLISGLLQDVAAHEESRYDEIGADFDKVEGDLPQGDGSEFHKLHVALSFWDGWIDARNHGWLYYEPIAKENWPTLARQIVNDIRADLEITNPIVVDKFDFANRPPAQALGRD
jgi:hypothetical protein